MKTLQANGAQQAPNHRIGSIYLLSFGCLLLTACLATAQSKPDYSTPLAAAKTYYMAMKNGDEKTLNSVCIGTGYRKRFTVMVMRSCVAYDKLDQAAAAKFGRQQTDKALDEIKRSLAWPAIALAALTNCQVKMEGTNATIIFKPNEAEEAPELAKLQQASGEWKILLGADLDKSDFSAAAFEATAKSMDQCATDVPAGKYKTAEEAAQGMMTAMMEQYGQSPERQVMQGKLERASVEPARLAAGQSMTMTYQPYHTIIGGVLGDAEQVTLHYGFNGWSRVVDQPMTSQGEEKWKAKLNLPADAHELDFCFTDGTRWDNNGGQDWRLVVHQDASKGGTTSTMIGAAEAAKHYNESLIVTGQVAQVSFKPTLVYVDLDKPRPDSPFTAVIFSAATNGFGDLSRLMGKDVEIRGTIKEYGGRPEIVLDETNQLRAVGRAE